MAKRRKIASLLTFGHLPDEIILEIFTYLEFLDNASASQVCKKWKLLSEDQFLWQKINLSDRRVPAKFIEKALRHGCQYLSLCGTEIKYLPKYAFSAPNQLKYLSISCSIYYQDYPIVSDHEILMKNLLSASQSLEKLSIRFGNQDHEYGTHFQPNIIQNSQTLTVLKIEDLKPLGLDTIQLIFTNCLELTEVSFMVRDTFALHAIPHTT
jgi:hypothetical protein